jgi:hypothetical protein
MTVSADNICLLDNVRNGPRGSTSPVAWRGQASEANKDYPESMFEKSWQIKTHGTRTRVRPSRLEAGMGKHSR